MSESNNGCSLNQHIRKDLTLKSSYNSGVGHPRSASDTARRKHASALSLFPKFNAFVTRTTTCWLWTAGLDAYGYGQIATGEGGAPMKVHRLAWMFAHGPIPSRAHVLHKCDVRHCVNPAHLFLGDQAANMKDAAAKGRLHVERKNAHRVSSKVVAAIKAAPEAHGVTKRLAVKFGVSASYVSLIRKGLRRQYQPSAWPRLRPAASVASPSRPVPPPPSTSGVV